MEKFYSSYWPLILALVFYFAGVPFIHQGGVEHLKVMGIVNQEEYTYADSDGEEHEGETLMEVKGVGIVLTYKNVYFASVPMFFIAMFIGMIIFNHFDSRVKSEDSLKHIVFANCILGLILICLTTKQNIIPTILFWLGIISAASYKETNNEKN